MGVWGSVKGETPNFFTVHGFKASWVYGFRVSGLARGLGFQGFRDGLVVELV